jgi:Xaa-Pro aminopeptidase
MSKEIWEGPITGTENIQEIFGIKDAYPLGEFKNYLNKIMSEVNSKICLYKYPTENVINESGPNCLNLFVEKELRAFVDEQSNTSTKLINMEEMEPIDGSSSASYYNSSRYFVQLCRVKKSTSEIELMSQACNITSDAFQTAFQISHPFINEHLLYSRFDFDCRIRGSEYLSYIPVVAGGNRATTLHYIRNNQIIENNSLVLMDAGKRIY